MSSLAFLGLAVALALVGSLVVAFRNRPDRDAQDEVASFAKLMDALRPEDDEPGTRR